MTLLLIAFLILLMLKVPIAFSLFISSMLYFIVYDVSPIMAVQEIVSSVNAFSLLAIPGFILAGTLMNSGGITERIFDFANKLVGHIRGGLGHANVFASLIFSGMSGAAVADAAGLGKVELQAMKKAGYSEKFSLAVTGASSMVGPIIPPSIPAVIFGVTASVSIGQLFIAGIIPGLIMAFAICVYIYFYALKHRDTFPLPTKLSVKSIFHSFRHAFFALMSPVIILGGIMTGIVTPTEAAIVAVVYSIILGAFYKSLTIRSFFESVRETMETTISVMIIVAMAAVFGWILASEQAAQQLSMLLLDSINNKYIILLIITVIVLVVGMFMETIAAITILTPVLLPVVTQFGIDPIHFGIIMILNLMIGLLTPPVGMVLYVLSAISNISFLEISKMVLPYLILLISILLIFTFVPGIVTFLPNFIFE
ncbi:TRAP transporter large permease [Oceanobacillus locisalsi]|uniref:TRAP transporter large permease n=1 Tax=Oceanobacillus locisalsi TaxID=546107 RepID=A0ABW3NF47_9BACI